MESLTYQQHSDTSPLYKPSHAEAFIRHVTRLQLHSLVMDVCVQYVYIHSFLSSGRFASKHWM